MGSNDRIRVAAKMVTEDVLGADAVTELAGDFLWGAVIDKIGSQGFVDALFGTLGLEEEAAALA
jgi:hypothetical protein